MHCTHRVDCTANRAVSVSETKPMKKGRHGVANLCVAVICFVMLEIIVGAEGIKDPGWTTSLSTSRVSWTGKRACRHLEGGHRRHAACLGWEGSRGKRCIKRCSARICLTNLFWLSNFSCTGVGEWRERLERKTLSPPDHVPAHVCLFKMQAIARNCARRSGARRRNLESRNKEEAVSRYWYHQYLPGMNQWSTLRPPDKCHRERKWTSPNSEFEQVHLSHKSNEMSLSVFWMVCPWKPWHGRIQL